MSHFNHTVIACVLFFTLSSAIFMMFLFRKKKKQKKRKKDEDSNIENLDKINESKKVSSSYHKNMNKDHKEIKNIPVIESIDENITIINNDEKNLKINDYLNVTPDPISMDENDTGFSYITNDDKKLWICYRIVASYPLNYIITNSMGFIKPQETIKILIKFISLPDNQNSVYCFAEEHAIMIQWFFLSDSEMNNGPKYFFIKKYRKSNWRSKVIRCIFLDKYQQQDIKK
ncbi:MSP domain and PapD-like domain-containing protein [Strongyloides ratti]|uniref:MSP domain and PapD-like domain-containing protein n=1 Tax=Strongyloides ratti TaxID=34506 RepID=A0A090LPA0_STRRB|nr:MSP domain and PapD-like domain-containing protein [Strongyloides ratti]CEF69345.1 MSP domain and PapD-like domain-containing protein [Strongyloides ratti]